MNFISKFFLLLSLSCSPFISQNISAENESQMVFPNNPDNGPHEPYYVGGLGKKWQFPSDHLPRGMSIGNTHIAFWNILNKNYLHHILENTQGLRDSSIMSDNYPVSGSSSLTVRELISIEMILAMINHPTHPRSMIALEEAHPDVITYLKDALPKSWVISTPPSQPSSQDVFLYDKKVFELVGVRAIRYQDNLPKAIFTVTLMERSSGEIFRFVQSHIPGGPNSDAGCKKFAEEAIKQYQEEETTILMGDMNAPPSTLQAALKKASENSNLKTQPYHYVAIDHPSHMNTLLEASWIDNFFIYRKAKMPGKVLPSNDPEELHENVTPIVDLMRIYTIQN
ncbi:MAG: hypothetical protein H0U49_00670 [Parachlamydiaceae bacterium]|nr:hypothetical protein [Parachlamydiaceae bacterium]